MQRKDITDNFDPSGVGLKNGKFIGLPFDEEMAQIVLLSVGWDATVSSGEGTASAPQNILEASSQLDLHDPDLEDAWKVGIFMRLPDDEVVSLNEALRPHARQYIKSLEQGGDPTAVPQMARAQAVINDACSWLKSRVENLCTELLEQGKLVGVVGGEHSVPLGLLHVLSNKYPGGFGILTIDAHQDLRNAYEGFTFSHASIFYNALQLPQIQRLVQVGIRDSCVEEIAEAKAQGARVVTWADHALRERSFNGQTYHALCEAIVDDLPQDVYVSVDIDGLDPALCPNTGTPVPGGLQYEEAMHLLRVLVQSGRRIIGFDLCEVAGSGHAWDGNVGARVLYKLCNFMAKSNHLSSAV